MRSLSAIHFLLAIFIPVLLFVLAGCKKAHEEKADLGAQVDPQEIQKVLDTVQNRVDINSLKANQQISYELNRRFVGQDNTYLLGSHQLQVLNRTSRSDLGLDLATILHNETIRKEDHFDQLKFEQTIPLKTPNATLQPGQPLVPGIQASAHMASDVRSVTYHNFETSTGKVQPPDKALARPNCAGLSPCELNVTYIKYDEVIWNADSSYDTVHYDFSFTSDLPYMGGLMGLMVAGCVSQNVPIGQYRYLVRDCQYITDVSK